MTCPLPVPGILNRARSYRDLPMRLGETSTLFRNEDSGEMHGLIPGPPVHHLRGPPDPAAGAAGGGIQGLPELAKYCLETVGMLEDCTFRFSQWDPQQQGRNISARRSRDEAQSIMGKILTISR